MSIFVALPHENRMTYHDGLSLAKFLNVICLLNTKTPVNSFVSHLFHSVFSEVVG